MRKIRHPGDADTCDKGMPPKQRKGRGSAENKYTHNFWPTMSLGLWMGITLSMKNERIDNDDNGDGDGDDDDDNNDDDATFDAPTNQPTGRPTDRPT